MSELELLIPPELPNTEPRPAVDPTVHSPSLSDALLHARGTEDPVYAAALTPRQIGDEREPLARAARELWLPEGYHYGLHIEHRSLESAGPYTGGGNKWVWHITVSGWMLVDEMYGVLRDKRAAPHLVIGGRPGLKRPVVIQMIPFNLAGRALAHPSGPETNRADCIQVEVCATPEGVAEWTENVYKALANLVRLTNNTNPKSRDVTRHLARSFNNTQRFGGQEFVSKSGHCGHMHVPGNDHTDPTTKFKGGHIINLLERMPDGGYPLG